MRRLLIILAAIALLAGEPAVAAPIPLPHVAMPGVNLELIPGLLYRMVHPGGTSSSPQVR